MPNNDCCRRCCSSITSIALFILIIWIILRTAHTPKLSLLVLQVPALNYSQENSTLSFKLKLDNSNLGIGIYYSNLNTTFHYPANANQSSVIADVIVPAFYQGHRKKAVKTGSGETRGVNWTEVAAGLNGTAASFRVHVDGTVKFKYIWWRSKKRRVSVEGVAAVDAQGNYATEKGVRLRSGVKTRVPDMGCRLLLLLVFFVNHGITGFARWFF
ncbi:hypothetical protein QQ045_006835 [Rhodiola kirilowii]